MTVVLALPGAGGNMWDMRRRFRRTITDGQTVVHVPYNNLWPTAGNAANATDMLNDYITDPDYAGQDKLVFGFSMGSRIASQWLRRYGPTSTVPPSELSFLLSGNPERKYGGALYVDPVQWPETWDGLGIPADTSYDVIDFARQYDGWCDWPNVPNPSATAIRNAEIGQSLFGGHGDYYNVTLTDAANLSLVEGNVTYMFSPTTETYFGDYAVVEESHVRPEQATPEPPPEPPPPPPPPVGPPPGTPVPSPTTPPGSTPPPGSVPSSAEGLRANNDWRLAEQADIVADVKTRISKDWLVKIYDKFWTPIGEMGDDMMELTGTDPRNGLPTGVLKIKGSSDKVALFEECTSTMVGVTVETQGLRFAFYVDTFDYEFDGKSWTGTVHLNGIYDILNYYQIWPNWLLPIQAQIPSHAVFIWALCTVLETMVAECALRLQSGWNEFLNNALSLNLDVRTWIGTLLQSNGNIKTMLKTPMYVVRTNPLLDTSPLVARTVRMESCGTVIADLTKAYGVDTRVDLWLPGDAQPDEWVHLDQPTYVFTAKDRSQIEGPTKTVLDSVIRTTVDAAGAFFGELEPLIQTTPGMDGVFQSPLLGIKFVPPWAVLVAPEPELGEKGSVSSCKISHHTPKGWQMIQGGRSPKWLNDLMNATYAWLIDSISILIGFTGIPSNILEGLANNLFLAFQLIQHYTRRDSVGPYHPAIEVFAATASSPYNIEAMFAFINMLWDTRGYVSAQATFRNGEVYLLGRDVFKGGLISILYRQRTRLLTDYIEMVLFRITPTERDVMVQIGDGNAEESPLARHQRNITGVFESINVLTLAPQS
jgi:hypothetical protein